MIDATASELFVSAVGPEADDNEVWLDGFELWVFEALEFEPNAVELPECEPPEEWLPRVVPVAEVALVGVSDPVVAPPSGKPSDPFLDEESPHADVVSATATRLSTHVLATERRVVHSGRDGCP